MVHALQDAHRVLKPGGILIDLRPAPAHRRIGLGEGRRWRLVGALHEILDDDYAADAAIAQLVREKHLRPERNLRFRIDRVMDTMDDIREFIDEFHERRHLPTHAPLLEELERQRARLRKPARITVRGPMKLGVLRKLEPAVHETRREP